MELIKYNIEYALTGIGHWAYVKIDYILSISLALWATSRWGIEALSLLGKLVMGVGIGLLTAFAVTVYRVFAEPKITSWLKKKKEKKEQKKANQ